VYVETGHVLFSSIEGNLMALPVDSRLQPTGSPILLLDGIRTGNNAAGIWTAAPNGTIVASRSNSSGSTIVAVDRTGRATPLSDEMRRYRLPRVSPDGNRIAIQASATGINSDADIWILDRRTGALSRFTSGGGNSDAIWSPDGRRIAWAGPVRGDTDTVDRNVPAELRGVADMYWQPVDKSTPPEVLYAAPRPQWPWSFTPDGKTLLFDEGGGNTHIMALTVGSGGPPKTIVESEFANRLGKFSPDGRWIAYASNETGRMEVYVRPFPGPGGAVQVSVDGGDQPLWSRNSPELFYRDGANMVAATLSQGAVKSRSVLFQDTFDRSNATNFDVLPGGGFIMLKSPGEDQGLTALVNWKTEILRRARAAQR
jgi:dipeptidyl aminopeptidase/acylaminoacyl peptidase